MNSEKREKRYLFALTVCCLLTLGFYAASYMRIPVVPLYARSLGATTSTVGVINSVFFLTAGCLSIPMGYLCDRVGRKKTAAVGTLVVSITSFLLALTKTPLQIMPVYFFFGVGLSAYGPTMMSYVADISPTTHLGRSYGWYTTSLYTGMSVGPAIGGWIADKMGYISTFVASGFLMFVVFVVLVFCLPSGARIVSSASANKSGEWLLIFRNRYLWACWIITLALCYELGMFITFVPLLAKDRGIPLASIGIIFLLQGLSNGFSRIPFGHWSDKTSDRRRLVIAGVLGTGVAIAGFGFSRLLSQFLLFAVILGAGLALAFTSIGALIALVSSEQTRGLAMGGYNTCIYLGIMVSSLLMGKFIERAGFTSAFLVASLVGVFFLVIFVYLFRSFYSGKT